MDTLCLMQVGGVITIALPLNALIKTKTHYQAASLTPMELYFTMLKPTATVYPALHTTTTKN
jgi:hypothetical protein